MALTSDSLHGDGDDRATARPGDVNAHTHVYSGLAPLGMPPPARPPENFLEILEHVWWRLDRALDAPSLEASARLYMAEALLAGTTTLIDHHESPGFIEGSLDVLADAAEELGLRLVTCYGATERNGGRDEARQGLAECRRFVSTNRRPLVRGMVGLHASFTVSDETIREAAELAREFGVPVHVHVAEDRADVEDARKRGYAGPLERLLALDGLPPGSILAHGVHLDRSQVEAANRAGLWLVQNPRSNEGNRVGYPRGLAASRRVALGTDGYPADMEAEWDALLASAARNGDELAGNLEALRERRLAGRALAKELFARVLSPALVPGLAADLVTDASGGGPRRVLVAGRAVVQDGRLLAGNLEAIRAHAASEAARLWRRMAAL
ncbi:MAG: amidohydrolase family protein [Planctomycetes bacterium]|nr:amidohydrolase family protein [Planctomycetota bacterium]